MSKINFNKITNTNIQIILQACQKLGIGFEVLDWENYKIRLTKSKKTHIITAKSMGLNPHQAIVISRDKNKTIKCLKKMRLPVLPQIKVASLGDYQKKANQIPFPQVIKPRFGEKGKNVYLNIKTKTLAQKTIKEILSVSPEAVIEPYFEAQDYRFLVLNQKVIGLSQRLPPQITADGKSTIKQLILKENRRRFKFNQKVSRRMLNRMLIWQRIKWYLKLRGLNLQSILPKNQKLIVYPIPNFSTGGTVKTISFKKIHPSYLNLALKATKAVGLTIAGVDMLIKDIKQPVSASNCAIIEINSDPGLRLHDWPNQGKPQNVTPKILNFIFANHS